MEFRHFSPQIKRQPCPRAFSLIEILAVLGLTALLTALAVPAVNSLSKGTDLGNAARYTMNLLTVARTEAITKRVLTRFVVVTNWEGNAAANYRKMSVWSSATGAANSWQQITNWEEIPTGIIFDPESASYINSPAANFLLQEQSQNTFSATIGGKTVEMNYVEFLPGGAARIPGTSGPEVWFSLTPGHVDNAVTHTSGQNDQGNPLNWAKISANTLTGRLKVTRP